MHHAKLQRPEREQALHRDREEPGDDPRDTPRPHQFSLPDSRAVAAWIKPNAPGRLPASASPRISRTALSSFKP